MYKQGEGFTGHKHTEEVKRKIGRGNAESLKGNKNALGGKGRLGQPHTEQSKRKMSKAHTGKKLSEAHKRKIGIANTGKRITVEVKEKIRAIRLRQWQNVEFAKKMFRSWHRAPNKKEIELDVFLQSVLPDEYKFVGAGEVIFGRKCPDFINVNGKKHVIELYGNYWHRGQEPQDRINHFAKYGYNCLIIWEHELQKPLILTKKILQFHKGEQNVI